MTIHVDGPHVVTKNILCLYTKNLELIASKMIVDFHLKESTKYDGLEDIRLFVYKDNLRFVCTVFEDNRPQMRLGSLGLLEEIIQNIQDDLIDEIPLISLVTIDVPIKLNYSEKNWIPIIRNNKIWLIYDIGREIWFQVSSKGVVKQIYRQGEYRFGKKIIPPRDIFTARQLIVDYPLNHENFHGYLNLRGSSSPIPYREGFICLAHNSSCMGNYYKYVHYFVYLNMKGRIIRVSEAFTFTHSPMEYCMSMINKNNNFILIYSIYDNYVECISIDDKMIKKMLEL